MLLRDILAGHHPPPCRFRRADWCSRVIGPFETNLAAWIVAARCASSFDSPDGTSSRRFHKLLAVAIIIPVSSTAQRTTRRVETT